MALSAENQSFTFSSLCAHIKVFDSLKVKLLVRADRFRQGTQSAPAETKTEVFVAFTPTSKGHSHTNRNYYVSLGGHEKETSARSLFLCARLCDALKTPGRFHTSLLKATEGNKSARQDPPSTLERFKKKCRARCFIPCKCTCPILFYPRARHEIVKMKPGEHTHKKSSCAAARQPRERIKLLPRGCKNAITPAGKCFYE